MKSPPRLRRGTRGGRPLTLAIAPAIQKQLIRPLVERHTPDVAWVRDADNGSLGCSD